MGKPTGKKKKQGGASKTGDANSKRTRSTEATSKAFDEDMTIFVNMSQELKEEGNRLFQKRDPQGALLKYEKALKLLPKSHSDVPYLHTSMAACFIEMCPGEYHNAITECNLALEVSPSYNIALLKRARCYESLNMLELAFQDITQVLSSEPTAQEIADRIRKKLENRGVGTEEILASPTYITSSSGDSPLNKAIKSKTKKKKYRKSDEMISGSGDKAVEKESTSVRNVKLLVGDDIRLAQMPCNCSFLQLREVVRNRFPKLKGVLIKYKDSEGDLVTITTTEELRWAETSADPRGSVRLYVVEVSPDKEPSFEEAKSVVKDWIVLRRREESETVCIEDWIVQFARLFKNHVGFNADTCLDLHELGMKLYAESMEDTVTSEEAQELFEVAAEKFQEMTALALFNWGNVHMSRARRRVLTEVASRESVVDQVKTAYEWAVSEYVRAEEKYTESVRFKPDFYEGHLALGQQQFERAKLSWSFAAGNKANLETWPSEGLLDLFESVEDCITKGSEKWEVVEEQRLNDLSKPDKGKMLLQKMGLVGLFKDISPEEGAEQIASIQSQINLLWGTVLYQRSVFEFKLRNQFWEDTLETAIQRFELAGASQIDIAVMRKNHCSNSSAHEGSGFDIDEIAQAWSEMYDAKRWMSGVPSFRLEPSLRRRLPKLQLMLEHA